MPHILYILSLIIGGAIVLFCLLFVVCIGVVAYVLEQERKSMRSWSWHVDMDIDDLTEII